MYFEELVVGAEFVGRGRTLTEADLSIACMVTPSRAARGRSEMGRVHRDDCAQAALFIGDEMQRFMRVEIGVAPRGVHGSPNHLFGQGKLGRSTGLEPATLGTTNRCSNQLSYDRHA